MTSSSQQDSCVECNAAEVTVNTVPGPSTASTTISLASPQRSEHVSPNTDEQEDVMDPRTFRAPDLGSLKGVAIVIEYCDRCRWGPRASWTSTELFLTFPAPLIGSITLMPCIDPAGRFRVWLTRPGEGMKNELMWDRKLEGGFPELKLLKQRIRNVIQPEKSLGHSDGHATAIKSE